MTIADTLIAGLSIAAFGWGAYFFGRWWILLFTAVPLCLFYAHTVIVDADLAETQKGGEADE